MRSVTELVQSMFLIKLKFYYKFFYFSLFLFVTVIAFLAHTRSIKALLVAIRYRYLQNGFFFFRFRNRNFKPIEKLFHSKRKKNKMKMLATRQFNRIVFLYGSMRKFNEHNTYFLSLLLLLGKFKNLYVFISITVSYIVR